MTSGFQIDRAARCVLSGGVIAYPTDTVFGLGCLPEALDACERIIELKQRDARKGLLLIAATLEHVNEHALLPEGAMRERVLESWPGPVTWLLEARAHVPRAVTGGGGRLGVRVTGHDVARRLCERVGSALVSTSANPAGRPPLTSRLAIRRAFGDAVDYILPGEPGDPRRASTIRDARDGSVVRAG